MSMGLDIAIRSMGFLDLLDAEERELAARVHEAEGDERRIAAAMDAARRRLAQEIEATLRRLPPLAGSNPEPCTRDRVRARRPRRRADPAPPGGRARSVARAAARDRALRLGPRGARGDRAGRSRGIRAPGRRRLGRSGSRGAGALLPRRAPLGVRRRASRRSETRSADRRASRGNGQAARRPAPRGRAKVPHAGPPPHPRLGRARNLARHRNGGLVGARGRAAARRASPP